MVRALNSRLKGAGSIRGRVAPWGNNLRQVVHIHVSLSRSKEHAACTSYGIWHTLPFHCKDEPQSTVSDLIFNVGT